MLGGNKMKVLQINTVCGTGSTGRIATDIHKMLIEQDMKALLHMGEERLTIVTML